MDCTETYLNMDCTETYLWKFLDKRLDELDYSPRKVQVKPISTEGANYSSVLFKVATTSPNKGTLHLFSKVANIGEKVREVMPVAQMLRTEKLVYEELQKSYKNLQIKHHIPEKDRFHFAKYYGSSLEAGREVFLFEDLNETGYQIYDRFESLQWNHVSENIKVLAKFHALSFALEIENPELYKKITDFVFPVEVMIQSFAAHSETSFVGLSEHHSTKLREFVQTLGGMEALAEFYKPFGRGVIIHGDYRPSNIMYRQQGDNIAVLPVDYQTVRGGSAVSDVLYYVVTATDGEFRRRHFEQLLALYHEQLGRFLAALGLRIDDVYPRQQFGKELAKMLPLTALLGLAMYPTLLVPPAAAPSLAGPAASVAAFRPPVSPLATQRLADLVDDCSRWKLI